MSKINILPKEVFNRISAGEVIERPASVVKELFENAADAGSLNISIRIENGGLDEIVVQDDGEGMDEEDLKRAFLPHATSKIKEASDLDFVDSLGFRGEALASIGAVSDARIISKAEGQQEGPYQIRCDAGEIGNITDANGIVGTTVIVNRLFYNTPVRLKFLKSAKGEEREVTNIVDKLILANSHRSVNYFVDDILIRQTYGDGLRDAVMTVYGKEAIENCYEINADKNGIFVHGFIGSTNYYKPNRTYQTIILNGRYITDNTIATAMQNAYSNYLMKRQYPFYVLSITIDPEFVDVNVHPRKAEVRFSNNQIVYGSIYSIVSKVLDGSSQALNIVTSAPFIKPTKEELKPPEGYEPIGFKLDDDIFPPLPQGPVWYDSKMYKGDEHYKGDYDITPVKLGKFPLSDSKWDEVTDFTDIETRFPKKKDYLDEVFEENKSYIEKLEAEKKAIQQELEQDMPIRYIGQALGTYIINECGDELIIIDQHAAHERILFDNYYNLIKARTVEKQPLLVPYTFTTNDEEANILYDMKDIFVQAGFDIDFYKENMFRVYCVPYEIATLDLTEFFRDILTDEQFKMEKIPAVIREKIAQKACKSAIKAGDKISLEEVNALLERLKQNWGLKCPHGRPVAVKIKKTEIDKWFKRIV